MLIKLRNVDWVVFSYLPDNLERVPLYNKRNLACLF